MDYTGQSLDRGDDGPPKFPEQPLDTDFAKKFPPDPTLGDEIGETARVWKVYRAEAEARDNTMLDGWNKTLDVLLIFAGLFSAVATAFLIDSYKLLRPDNSAAYMSTALYLLVMRDNISSTIPLPPPPPLATSASTISTLVNTLWFISLLVSLSVALLGILAKQWIVQYNARIAVSAQSPIKWAIRRQMYFNEISSVGNLVSFLPVLLHASLFLFFAGVAIFVWNLDFLLGISVSLLGLTLGVFYMACSLLPLWIPESPISTPLFNELRLSFLAVHIFTLHLRVAVCTRTAQVRRALRLSRRGPASDPQGVPIVHRDSSDDNGQSDTIEQLMSAISSARARRTRSPANYRDVPKERVDDLTAQALLWVMFSVADNDAHAVGMQALGAVPSHGAVAKYIRRDAGVNVRRITGGEIYISTGEINPVQNARIVRSLLWLRDKPPAPDIARDINLWRWCYFPTSDYPDMLFLDVVRDTVTVQRRGRGNVLPPPHGWQSASISSTVLLFLRARHLDFTNLVEALLWCDFSHLLHEDCTFVLERIVSEGSTRTSLRLLPCTTPLVCIVDVLAQCIMQSAEDENNMAVHRLLITLLTGISNRHSVYHDQTFVSSFVSAYLVSDSFAEQQMESGVLQSLTSAVLTDALRVAEAYPPAMEIYFNLLNHLLPLLLRQQAELLDYICDQSASVLPTYKTLDRVPTGQVLSLTLARILMPTARQPLLSIWDMLRGTHFSGRLANGLALTLCMAERSGEDVSPMVDIFLSQLSLQKLFEMRIAIVDYYKRREGFGSVARFPRWVTPLIQSCVDLRPAWWFKSLIALRGDECAEPELKQSLPELEAIPLYRGICDRCHRLPRGWEDDDDPPSLCGFNPAPPGPSSVPASMSTPDARTPWHCSLCH